MQRFTETVSVEVAEQGIQIFSVGPGAVRTPLFEYGLHCGVPAVEQFFAYFVAEGLTIPAERAAELVVYLASGQADALSGHFFDAAEDVRAVMQRADQIRDDGLYILCALT